MAKNKAGFVFVAYILLIASVPLGGAAIVLAAFAIMALLSSPASGGGLRSALSFLLLSLVMGGCCVLMARVGFGLLRRT